MAAPPAHWLPAFLRFCSLVRITSKEDGEVPIVPYDAQMRFLSELNNALQEDIHHVVCLKARQLGLSTIMLALDIFYLFMFEGLQGALIFDNAKNLTTARRLITQMIESLPPEWSIPIKSHNREELVFENGSTLQYMSAGKGKNSGLGRSRALNFVHASEISSWGDQDGIDSLMKALAIENPNRLYIFESTALGYNVFYDMVQEAKESSVQHFIFLGWWSKGEVYRIKEGTPEFQRWWGEAPFLTDEEALTQHEVQELYNHTITPEQWAWYRRDSWNKSEQSQKSEMPSTESEAFQATGAAFFSLKRVGSDMAFLHQAGSRAGYQGFRYHLGTKFTSLKIEQVNNQDDVELRVWEQPRNGAQYVMGVDVAYGRDEDSDRSCISVWRAYADKLVQVAEYATPMPETRQVAWVLAHLAGCYRDSFVNLEITGPGAQVMAELKYLKEQIQFGQLRETAQAIHPEWALDQMKWFLYTRPDSLAPNYCYNFKTGLENKLFLMNRYRDSYNTEEVLVRSMPLLTEKTKYVQEGYSLHASGRNKDDRVMAAGLAHFAWAEWVRTPMMQANQTYDRVMLREQQEDQKGVPVIDWIIPRLLAEYEENKLAQEDRIRRYTEI